MGLQFSSMLLCLLTIVLGAGTVAAELESGMIHAVLARPVSRTSYILGKFSGLALLTVVCATVFYAALLLIAGTFSLSTVTALSAGQILGGWIIFILVPLCVLCLTLYGSVSLRVVPNGLLMIFIYILGSIGGMVEMIGNLMNSRPVVSAGIFLSPRLALPHPVRGGGADSAALVRPRRRNDAGPGRTDGSGRRPAPRCTSISPSTPWAFWLWPCANSGKRTSTDSKRGIMHRSTRGAVTLRRAPRARKFVEINRIIDILLIL
jgi:hypothetical protein